MEVIMHFVNEEIAGCYVNGRLVCFDCYQKDESSKKLTARMVLTWEQIEEDGGLYFCEECLEEITL